VDAILCYACVSQYIFDNTSDGIRFFAGWVLAKAENRERLDGDIAIRVSY